LKRSWYERRHRPADFTAIGQVYDLQRDVESVSDCRSHFKALRAPTPCDIFPAPNTHPVTIAMLSKLVNNKVIVIKLSREKASLSAPNQMGDNDFRRFCQASLKQEDHQCRFGLEIFWSGSGIIPSKTLGIE
jgi:hypothetical protein